MVSYFTPMKTVDITVILILFAKTVKRITSKFRNFIIIKILIIMDFKVTA